MYHVIARGNRRGAIYRTHSDRLVWLSLLGETCERFNFRVHAYCQMTNHYHMVVETVGGRLARGMRYLNGNYSQYFNRQHELVGHVFQGRYTAILCQRETYLMELSRYVVLNPVRAKLVSQPVEWPWSSYRAIVGLHDAPSWLQHDLTLAHFDAHQASARRAYEEFVLKGIGKPSPLAAIRNQLFLGNDDFCENFIDHQVPGDLIEVKRAQRRAIVHALPDYFRQYRDPKEAMAMAYLSLGYSMHEIARYCGVCVKTVQRAVKKSREIKRTS
ncbi:transposase [Pseudoduganella sp. UC29_106]|uniref:transposase n=1 Tax=Pseudoduganella sp. UC29_106 TaxID=3374553 RepID=UPI003756EA45